MIIGGYKNEKQSDSVPEFVDLREISFVCTQQELDILSSFFVEVRASLSNYTFPYGHCTVQFRDKIESWKKGDPDIVIVVTPNSKEKTE